MSTDNGLFLNDDFEAHRDGTLEMIFQLIEEANHVHADMLAASIRSDLTVFDTYNELSLIDEHIEMLTQMHSVNKHRYQMNFRQ